MRLPKTVRINNRPWRVKEAKSTSGSHFSFNNMTIKVGTKNNSQREILTGFMHEITEISCCERGVRCLTTRDTGAGNGDYRFVGNHEQFSDVISDVSSIIGDMMKLR